MSENEPRVNPVPAREYELGYDAERDLVGWMDEIRPSARKREVEPEEDSWGTQPASPAFGPLCLYWHWNGEDPEAAICGHGSCYQIVFEQDRDEDDE